MTSVPRRSDVDRELTRLAGDAMMRDQVEHQIGRASAEGQHSLAHLMAMAGNNLIGSLIELSHYLAIGPPGCPCAWCNPIQHADLRSRFSEMKRRGATGNTGAYDNNVVAFA